jgi:hypothetical protein
MHFQASESDGTHRCPHCSAHYRVVAWLTTIARDADKEMCGCCNHIMAFWNATSYPKFALIGECPGDKGGEFIEGGSA